MLKRFISEEVGFLRDLCYSRFRCKGYPKDLNQGFATAKDVN